MKQTEKVMTYKEVFLTLPYILTNVFLVLLGFIVLIAALFGQEEFLLALVTLVLGMLASVLVVLSIKVLISKTKSNLIKNKFLLFYAEKIYNILILCYILFFDFKFSYTPREFMYYIEEQWILLVLIFGLCVLHTKLSRKYLRKYILNTELDNNTK